MSMDTLKILLVEDEKEVIQDWKREVELHNEDQDERKFTIQMETASSDPEARRMLELHRFDAAVVDLRLRTGKGAAENNSQGNDLVRHILETHPIGIAIYTGQSAYAEEFKDAGNEVCHQVRVFDKGDGIAPVFVWLAEQKDMLLRLRQAKAAFNRQTARMFFRSIWPRWQTWDSQISDKEELAKALVRHIVAHVHDALLDASGGQVHPEEAYFVPPLKGRLETGDLFFDEQHHDTWILVTPRCDLANPGKVETVLLASCQDISSEWEQRKRLQKEGQQQESSKAKKAGEWMQHTMQHGRSPKQHFLHPMVAPDGSQKGPWMIQFHKLQVLRVDELQDRPADGERRQPRPLKRMASLSPLYIPSLVERFGAYFSRIGTPDYSSH